MSDKPNKTQLQVAVNHTTAVIRDMSNVAHPHDFNGGLTCKNCGGTSKEILMKQSFECSRELIRDAKAAIGRVYLSAVEPGQRFRFIGPDSYAGSYIKLRNNEWLHVSHVANTLHDSYKYVYASAVDYCLCATNADLQVELL